MLTRTKHAQGDAAAVRSEAVCFIRLTQLVNVVGFRICMEVYADRFLYDRRCSVSLGELVFPGDLFANAISSKNCLDPRSVEICLGRQESVDLASVQALYRFESLLLIITRNFYHFQSVLNQLILFSQFSCQFLSFLFTSTSELF